MNGEWAYENDELAVLIFFTPLIVYFIIWNGMNGWFWVCVGLTVILLHYFSRMKVRYRADENGVEIRTPFRKYFFDYSEIISVKAETSENGHSHSRWGENGTYYECCMTIVTEKKIYRFFEPLGLVLAEDAVNFPDKVRSRLYDTELTRLTEFITQRKRGRAK